MSKIVARQALTLNAEQIKVACDDIAGHTDVHFGLIPLDPTRNGDQIEPRYRAGYAGDEEGEYAVLVFTNGDNFVEWGEPMTYDGPERHETGRLYNAPGLHVVVRFPKMPPVEAEYYPKPWPAHNPTGLWKSPETKAYDRKQELFALGVRAVEVMFADMLSDDWRLCDYACLTDSVDWSEPPAWAVNEHGAGMVGMYA